VAKIDLRLVPDTLADAPLIVKALAVYRKAGMDPIVLPRSAGSWRGYLFTGDPLRLPAGPFGLGHGDGAHAPNEYFLIESARPKVQGIDGAVRSYVELLYAMA
jgi:acetylornithine deacetylase/succinyl-diaminopimelate desuccinylase-like protein